MILSLFKKILIILIITTHYLNGQNINIAVASNVSYAINDLIKEFNKIYPNTVIKVTLGSSGQLFVQISNGAAYSMFLSANLKYPKKLYENNIAINKPKIYAKGQLSLFSTNSRKFTHNLEILQNDNIAKIAIANPKTAPYGIATIQALKNSNIFNKIKHKLIFAQSISQTISYTMTSTDIGIVAKSSLYSPNMSKYKQNINFQDIDTKLYTPINQGIVILKNQKINAGVKAFYNFMLSQRAKNILIKFGYLI
jgi:molybdate transport system substrate-binding protein